MGKRSTKFYRKNEKEVMNRLGLEETRNSGATWIDKADGRNEHCLCELKSTDKYSYSIKQNTLHKLEVQAIEAHKLPVFALQFLNTDEVWLAVKETDIEAFKNIIRKQTLEELGEQKEKAFEEFNKAYFGDKQEYEGKRKPICFGNENMFTNICSENCKYSNLCKKEVDKQRIKEYNIDKDLKKKTNPAKNAKANLSARKKIQEQREKERKDGQKAWKKRLNKKALQHFKD